jgi:hypothetical protein
MFQIPFNEGFFYQGLDKAYFFQPVNRQTSKHDRVTFNLCFSVALRKFLHLHAI